MNSCTPNNIQEVRLLSWIVYHGMQIRLQSQMLYPAPILCCTPSTTGLDFLNSPQGILTAPILNGYFSSISNFPVFAEICNFPLNSLSSYLSELICHKEWRCICFWLHVSNVRCSWMVNVVVWKYLKTKYFKKQFKILKKRENQVLSPFQFEILNYEFFMHSMLQIYSQMHYNFFMWWYSLLMISRGCVCTYIVILTFFVTNFSLPL